MMTQVKERKLRNSASPPTTPKPHEQSSHLRSWTAATLAGTPPLPALGSLLAPDTLIQIQRASFLKVHYLCFCSEGRAFFSRAANSTVATILTVEGSHQSGMVADLQDPHVPVSTPHRICRHIRQSPQEALDTEEHDCQATKNTMRGSCSAMRATALGMVGELRAHGPHLACSLILQGLVAKDDFYICINKWLGKKSNKNNILRQNESYVKFK